MKRLTIIIFILSGISFSIYSQKPDDKGTRRQIKSGNKAYRQEKYTDAEIDYRKALESNSKSIDAAYNLGNALYKQNKLKEAADQYQIVIGSEKDDKQKLASSWHNMGNIFMQGEDYAKSVEAYKRSLKNNPKDDETRYNLALAQKLLKDQQQNQDQQNKDQNKDQEDKKDQKDQKDQQNKDQNKDQQNKDQNEDQNKKDKTQEQPQQNEKMSRDNAQQILDAMLQDEKNTQEKVQEAQKRQLEQRKIDKNW